MGLFDLFKEKSPAENVHSLGVNLWSQHRYDEALKKFDEAIQLDPNFKWAWKFKAEILFLYHPMGTYNEAKKCYTKYLSLDPNDAHGWTYKGWLCYQNGDFFEAKECSEKALKLKIDRFDRVRALQIMGASLYYLHKYQESLDYSNKSLGIDRSKAETWYYKALSLCQLSQENEALKCIDTALNLDPSLWRSWEGKARILMRLQKNPEALECIENALKLNPIDGKLIELKLKLLKEK